MTLAMKNNQNNGIKKKGSCRIPCASTSEPITLKVTAQAAAAPNRRILNQDEILIAMFIFFRFLFVMDLCGIMIV